MLARNDFTSSFGNTIAGSDLKHCSNHDTQGEETTQNTTKHIEKKTSNKDLLIEAESQLESRNPNPPKRHEISFSLRPRPPRMRKKRTCEVGNNYLTGCPLRAQGENGWSISKKRPLRVCWVVFFFIIIIAVPRCAYRGGSLFLRGLALPPLPPPLTGARALVPRRLIGH